MNVNKNITYGITAVAIILCSLVQTLNYHGLPRFILGFVYICIIPGFLIYKLINLRYNSLEGLYFIFCFSILYDMILFLVLDVLAIYLGYKNVFSIFNYVNTITLFVILVTCIALKRYSYIKIEKPRPSIIIYTILLPLSIIGAYRLQIYSNPTLLEIMLILVSLIPLYIAIKNLITKNDLDVVYEYILLIVSISLLYHITLCTKYLGNWGDNQLEYFVSKIVLDHSIWLPNEYNLRKYGLLSLVALNPLISTATGLTLTTVFKVVRPLMFSTISVGLYMLHKKIFNAFKVSSPEIYSFYSVLLYMFIHSYYVTLSVNIRTSTAIMYLVLLYISLTEINNNINYAIVAVLSSFGIVLSHYGVAYMADIQIFIILLLLYVHKKSVENNLLKSKFLLMTVLSLGWYLYTSMSSTFSILINLAKYTKKMLSPSSFYSGSYAIHVLRLKLPFSAYMYARMLAIITIITIAGSLYLSRYTRDEIIKYLTISTAILAMLSILPLRKFFNLDRILPIVYTILSPYFILSIQIIHKKLSRKHYLELTNFTVSIILILLLLLGSGVIANIHDRGDFAPSTLLAKNRAQHIRDPNFIFGFYSQYYTIYDIAPAKWLHKTIQYDRIYVDNQKWSMRPLWGYGLLLEYRHVIYIHLLPTTKIHKYSYIYFRYYNCKLGVMFLEHFPIAQLYSVKRLNNKIYNSDKIYSTKYSKIYIKN